VQRKAGLLPAIACSPIRTQALCKPATCAVSFTQSPGIERTGRPASTHVLAICQRDRVRRVCQASAGRGSKGDFEPCCARISSIKMAATTDNGDLKAQLDAAQAAATKQGDTVRSLKALAKDGKADKAWHCPLLSLHCMFNERKAAHDERAGVEDGL